MRTRQLLAIGIAILSSSSALGCNCGGGDTTGMDAGEDDAGGGTPDAGTRDGGARVDAGMDSGTPGDDAGPPDAGPGDGGVEPMCSTTRPCSWRMLSPSDSPPVLAWAAMAYDAARDEIILFGGAPTITGGTLTDRTFAWDGTTWEERTPVDRPSARWTHAMVYDSDREVIVLFGGQSDSSGTALDDTWEWDGTNWSEVTTADAPSPRGVHGAMAYDSTRHRVIVRGGGTLPGSTVHGDTWEYDGTNWMSVGTGGPSARVAPAIVYDPARDVTLSYGGGEWSPYYGDTWTWDGTDWAMLSPATPPGNRQSARAIFDPTRSLVVMFGGDDGSLLNDLWEWDGTDWARVDVAGPPPRCCYAYAHDTARSQTVLFGGVDDQTWVYGATP